MRSVLHALIWDQVRHSGFVQLLLMATCLFPLIIYGVIFSVLPAGERADPVLLPLEISLLPFVVFVLFMGASVSYTNRSQLAIKPISNLSIAAWRILGGSLLLGLQVAFFAAFFNRSYGAGWPVAGAALFAIALWLAAQPFLCLAGKSVPGALVTMLPIGCMFAWFITRYKPIGGGTRDWNRITTSETVQLLAVIIVFAWLTIKCLALARRGDALPMPTSISDAFRKLLEWNISPRVRTRPFRSVYSAMFWYEWRWKGWQLAASFLFLLGLIVPIELSRELSLENYYDAVSSAYLATTVPAMILGVLNGFQLESVRVSMASETSGTKLDEVDKMGSFLATRPVTDAVLATSNLWVCLASIGLITALWMALVAPVMIFAASQGNLSQLFVRQELHTVPLIAVFLWIATSNLTMLTSTGRTKILGGICVASAIGFVALLALLDALDNQDFERLVLQGVLVCATLCLLGFVAWAYRRARALSFVSLNGSMAALVVIVAVPLVGCWVLGRIDLPTAAGLLCAGVLAVLPWAGTPLATRWNRHR